MTDADDAARRFRDTARAKEFASNPQLRESVFDRETKNVLELMRARVAVLAPQLGEKYRLRTTDRGAEVTTAEGDQLAALSLTAQEHSILRLCVRDELGVEECEEVQLLPLHGEDLWAVISKGPLDSSAFVEYCFRKLLDEATESLG